MLLLNFCVHMQAFSVYKRPARTILKCLQSDLGTKSHQNFPKIDPGYHKIALRCPKMAPRWLQVNCDRRARNAPSLTRCFTNRPKVQAPRSKHGQRCTVQGLGSRKDRQASSTFFVIINCFGSFSHHSRKRSFGNYVHRFKSVL